MTLLNARCIGRHPTPTVCAISNGDRKCLLYPAQTLE